MTRPIEKVDREAGCQQVSMLLNLTLWIVFTVSGVFDYANHNREQASIILLVIACGLFLIQLVFYSLTVMLDPGCVQKQPNFLRLLKRLIAENFHLDYVCVPCETLRPVEADHCNYCNRCVQKFDHHCIFVNNCVGYRNHKWFLMFLISFTLYLVSVVAHSLLMIVYYSVDAYSYNQSYWVLLNWILQIVLLVCATLHAPLLYLQIKTQTGKLCRQDDEEFEEEDLDEVTESRSASFAGANREEAN